MTPAHWSRVSDLFSSLADLDAAERLRLLDVEPESVRCEVERLLREHERSGLLDRPCIAASPTADKERTQWIGKVLNARYRIERFLARGGAGAVYAARDEQVAGRLVVVKLLQSSAQQDQWLKNKFREEMEALARIDHPGVVGILDAGETAEGLPFLVIEYIHGVTLRSEIRSGPLEIDRAARLLREMGRVVSAAHDKGVLHRDLKPENIMLEHAGTPRETVRLIDFGIARVDRPDEETRTHTTRFAGTTSYMAPEQLAGRPRRSSDIYALGVIAYEMLAGRRPFLAASPVELYEQQRAGVKSDLLRARQEIPAAAVRAILKQLSFRPEDRATTASEACDRIAAALEGRGPDTWSRRRVAGLLAGGAIASASVYSGIRFLPRRLDPSDRVIEMVMGTEPLEHGFKKSLDVDYHVLPNPDATRYESMRVISNDQGGYFHPFSAAQARQARANGWKLTIQATVEEGELYASIDNPLAPMRYAVNFLRNPDQTDSVKCMLAFAPVMRSIERVLPGPPGARHELVLSGAPSGDADLWVDGVKWITGYQGGPDYRYAHGLEFGATRYRSQRASGIFWKVRLEIG